MVKYIDPRAQVVEAAGGLAAWVTTNGREVNQFYPLRPVVVLVFNRGFEAAYISGERDSLTPPELLPHAHTRFFVIPSLLLEGIIKEKQG